MIREIDWKPIDERAKSLQWVIVRSDSGYVHSPYRCAVARWVSYSSKPHWEDSSGDWLIDSGPKPTHYIEIEWKCAP